MRTVTPEFLTAVSTSHEVATRVEVLNDGEVTLTLDTVTDGTVTLDQTAATRGRTDVTIVDPDLVPGAPTAALAPYGNELRVYRGVMFYETSEAPEPAAITRTPVPELVSLGIFRIDETSVTDNGDQLEIRVAGMDRSVRMIDARFEEPYTIAAGTNYATAIAATAAIAWPGITTNLTATSLTTPLLVAEEGADRWKFMQDMAASIGHSLYFDGDGILVSRPVSNPAGTPSIAIEEGSGGVLLTAGRKWSRQGTYNRVIATGENPSEGALPARGVATDDNPLSPTYYYGSYGKVPRFYGSQFLTTDAQALDAAQAILNRELGTTQTVDFGMLVNPALEPDDLVQVTRTRAGLTAEAHIVDSVTIPLTAEGTMTGRTRAVVS